MTFYVNNGNGINQTCTTPVLDNPGTTDYGTANLGVFDTDSLGVFDQDITWFAQAVHEVTKKSWRVLAVIILQATSWVWD